MIIYIKQFKLYLNLQADRKTIRLKFKRHCRLLNTNIFTYNIDRFLKIVNFSLFINMYVIIDSNNQVVLAYYKIYYRYLLTIKQDRY